MIFKAIKGDDFPYENHDFSEGEQWDRYNLPKYNIYIYTWNPNDPCFQGFDP